jgi:hypothetical protein
MINMSDLKNLLTADKARVIANDWQNNEVDSYVKKALEEIERRAKAGFFNAYITNPNATQVNKRLYEKAMCDLGYSIESSLSYGIWWAW